MPARQASCATGGVAAHYGSAATELAVCVKGVGLGVPLGPGHARAVRPSSVARPRAREALGGTDPADRFGDGDGGPCARADAQHAVVVAPGGAAARWRRIAREAIVVGNPIAFADRSADLTVLSLVGPRARGCGRSGLTGEPADVRTARSRRAGRVRARARRRRPGRGGRRRRRDGLARAGRRCAPLGPRWSGPTRWPASPRRGTRWSDRWSQPRHLPERVGWRGG